MRYKRAHPMGPRLNSWLRSPAGERTAVLVGFLALAIVWTQPLALRPGTTMAAPFGDPLLNAWILGWDADRLRHGLSGLWTAPPFYPYLDTLAYSEHLLGIAAPLAPIYWLTGNAVLLYNVALIGSFALAGIGMPAGARPHGRRDAALLAALAFMWCPNRAPHVTHLQVLMNGWMPLALWALHRYFATGSRRAAGFIAAFVVQGLSNGYFLFFLAVPVAMVAIVELVRHRDRLAARHPPGRGGDRDRPRHRAGRRHLPAREARAGAVADARGGRPVRGAAGGLRHGQPSAALVVEGPADRRGGEGAVPRPVVIVLALGVLVPSRHRNGDAPALVPAGVGVPLYAGIAVVAFVLSMGPEPVLRDGLRFSTGPYDWLAAVVPGPTACVRRFAAVVYVALAVLAAFGASRLLDRVTAPAIRAAMVLVLGVAAVAEGYMGPVPLERFPSADMAADRAAYEARDAAAGADDRAAARRARPAVRHQFRTLIHGNRIVNGYSGYGSALQDFLRGPPSTEGAGGDQLAMFRALGLRYVVVRPVVCRSRHRARYRGRDARADEARRASHDARAGDDRGAAAGRVGRAAEARRRRDPARLAHAVRLAQRRRAASCHRRQRRDALAERHAAGRHESIHIAFDRPGRPSFLRLVMDRRSFGDYPRRLEIDGSTA